MDMSFYLLPYGERDGGIGECAIAAWQPVRRPEDVQDTDKLSGKKLGVVADSYASSQPTTARSFR